MFFNFKENSKVMFSQLQNIYCEGEIREEINHNNSSSISFIKQRRFIKRHTCSNMQGNGGYSNKSTSGNQATPLSNMKSKIISEYVSSTLLDGKLSLGLKSFGLIHLVTWLPFLKPNVSGNGRLAGRHLAQSHHIEKARQV